MCLWRNQFYFNFRNQIIIILKLAASPFESGGDHSNMHWILSRRILRRLPIWSRLLSGGENGSRSWLRWFVLVVFLWNFVLIYNEIHRAIIQLIWITKTARTEQRALSFALCCSKEFSRFSSWERHTQVKPVGINSLQRCHTVSRSSLALHLDWNATDLPIIIGN